MRAIAERFPDARLDVQMPRTLVRSLGRGASWTRSCQSYAGSRALERLRPACGLLLRLRRRRFDLCILFPHARGVAEHGRPGRIPRRVGYAREGREALLTDPVPVPREPPRAPHGRLLLGARGHGRVRRRPRPGAASRPRRPPRCRASWRETPHRAPRRADRRDAGGRRPAASGAPASGTGRFVAVAPGAADGSAKRWPAAHFGALCGGSHGSSGTPCALLGSAGERELGATVREHAGTGSPSWTSPAAPIWARSSASSPRRPCSSATTPARPTSRPPSAVPGVTLFGSTSEGHSGPVGPRMRTLHRPLACSPCFERECPLGHHDCLMGSRSTTWSGRLGTPRTAQLHDSRRARTPHIWAHGVIDGRLRAASAAPPGAARQPPALPAAPDGARRDDATRAAPPVSGATVLAPPRGGDWRVRRAIGRLRPHALLLLDAPDDLGRAVFERARWWRFPVILVAGAAPELGPTAPDLLEAIDHFLVPDPPAAAALRGLGVAPSRISVAGSGAGRAGRTGSAPRTPARTPA